MSNNLKAIFSDILNGLGLSKAADPVAAFSKACRRAPTEGAKIFIDYASGLSLGDVSPEERYSLAKKDLHKNSRSDSQKAALVHVRRQWGLE